jgi:mannose-6-phosphate isomerase-like protein (cupin superfamily)
MTASSDRHDTAPLWIRLPVERDAVAPDGSDVRLLARTDTAGTAHFQLAGGQASVAIRHRTVDEIWYVVAGRGEMWLAGHGDASGATFPLEPGDCLSIPCGTRFQFRATDATPLAAFGVTMPPWPGDGEAIRCTGPWAATVPPGPGLAES